MGETLAQKIIRAHLLHGDMTPGSEIALRIDQTLTQDATGTMAYLEFETMGIPRVKTELSVAYVDHNTLQSGFENADDHRYLQTVAAKHGVWFSRPGNGICHQVHLERFGKPGKTLIGSDSHTPTGGGIGMLAFGAGGMDVAVAMGGGAYYITMPKMFKVNLIGTLRPFVTAKDISLELLRILSVKGGVGAIIEWGGPGIAALSVPERATITNMGTELGATTSIFPSDAVTRAFLAAEGRAADFTPLQSDPDAHYDRVIDIDLDKLQPMIACPHSPDNVVPVASLAGTKVDQVCIGSCTNSSLFDMLGRGAAARQDRRPGREPVHLAGIEAGADHARRLRRAHGHPRQRRAPAGVRLRARASAWASRRIPAACSCARSTATSTAAAARATRRSTSSRRRRRSPLRSSRLHHRPADPRARCPAVTLPERFRIDDSAVLPPVPAAEADTVEVLRGPNIRPIPRGEALCRLDRGAADAQGGRQHHDRPHHARRARRSCPTARTCPKLSEFCFTVCDETFPARAKAAGDGPSSSAAANYGQGSSREHAALVPMYLGVRAVVAKSFARIHAANLINDGILPLTFADPADYDALAQGDDLTIAGIFAGLESGTFTLTDTTTGETFARRVRTLTARQRDILRAGGLLATTQRRACAMNDIERACATVPHPAGRAASRRVAGMERVRQEESYEQKDRASACGGDGIGPIIVDAGRARAGSAARGRDRRAARWNYGASTA